QLRCHPIYFSTSPAAPPDLHSFPTRRSSDLAAQVDLIDPRIPFSGRDAVLGRVLGRDDADAVGGAGGRAERAADALLESVRVSRSEETRLNSSHSQISYAVFCLKKKKLTAYA